MIKPLTNKVILQNAFDCREKWRTVSSSPCDCQFCTIKNVVTVVPGMMIKGKDIHYGSNFYLARGEYFQSLTQYTKNVLLSNNKLLSESSLSRASWNQTDVLELSEDEFESVWTLTHCQTSFTVIGVDTLNDLIDIDRVKKFYDVFNKEFQHQSDFVAFIRDPCKIFEHNDLSMKEFVYCFNVAKIFSQNPHIAVVVASGETFCIQHNKISIVS